MIIDGHNIGVCSWSPKPRDMQDLVASVKKLGLEHVHLALLNLAMADDKRKFQELGILRNSGLKFTAGMINFPGEDYSTIAAIKKTGGYASAEQFPVRRQITKAAAKVAAELGIKLLTTHIGFVPPSSDTEYPAMVDRVCTVAEDLGALDLSLAMETGQESAPELLQFLNDLRCKNIGVNFDPANMILYGAGDPIEAIAILGRHIAHAHVKDAVLSEKPGSVWGDEVPFGAGQARPREFLVALKAAAYTGPLVIEREDGESRMQDIALAIETLKKAAV